MGTRVTQGARKPPLNIVSEPHSFIVRKEAGNIERWSVRFLGLNLTSTNDESDRDDLAEASELSKMHALINEADWLTEAVIQPTQTRLANSDS